MALGAGKLRILLRHALPNGMAPVLALATLGVGNAITLEAGLSFLGLGVQPPAASWGTMIASGRDTVVNAPWVGLAPGIALVLVVIGCTLVADAVREPVSRETVRRESRRLKGSCPTLPLTTKESLPGQERLLPHSLQPGGARLSATRGASARLTVCSPAPRLRRRLWPGGMAGSLVEVVPGELAHRLEQCHRENLWRTPFVLEEPGARIASPRLPAPAAT